MPQTPLVNIPPKADRLTPSNRWNDFSKVERQTDEYVLSRKHSNANFEPGYEISKA
jgi:hypothetical protein